MVAFTYLQGGGDCCEVFVLAWTLERYAVRQTKDAHGKIEASQSLKAAERDRWCAYALSAKFIR
jgi:hypothetical protein